MNKPPKKLHTLIVEDDARTARALRDALAELDCPVCGHAYTGVGAALMAERFLPDLIAISTRLSDGIAAAQIMKDRVDATILFIGDPPDPATHRLAEAVGVLVRKPQKAELNAAILAAFRRGNRPAKPTWRREGIQVPIVPIAV